MIVLVFALFMTSDPLDVTRSQSPWSGLSSDAKQESDGMHVNAVVFSDALEKIPRLDALCSQQLLAIDRKAGRVVVNEKFLSPLERVDVLRLEQGKKHTLGTVKDKALLKDSQALATFFVASSIIQTYAHVGSHLSIAKAVDGVFEFDGEHEYFTNSRHVKRVHFTVTIDQKSGVVTVAAL